MGASVMASVMASNANVHRALRNVMVNVLTPKPRMNIAVLVIINVATMKRVRYLLASAIQVEDAAAISAKTIQTITTIAVAKGNATAQM